MPLYRKNKSPFWYYTLTIDGQRVRGSTKQKVKSKAQEVLDEQRLKARVTGIQSLTRKAPTLEEVRKVNQAVSKLMEEIQNKTEAK